MRELKIDELLAYLQGKTITFAFSTDKQEEVISLSHPVNISSIKVYVNGNLHKDIEVHPYTLKIKNMGEGEKTIIVEYQPVR
jgi:Fe-S cluster assembly scaffold protein SufB